MSEKTDKMDNPKDKNRKRRMTDKQTEMDEKTKIDKYRWQTKMTNRQTNRQETDRQTESQQKLKWMIDEKTDKQTDKRQK